MIKKPLISVIVPVYNVENYLEATIESIINQSLRFKDNIELILVNDGSPDNSERAILKYRDKYPNNVIYIKQKNSGVSVARNTGLDVARGKYVHFMDSDDIISRNFYKKSIEMLVKYKNKIDFVCSKIKYFDSEYYHHYLNSKYKSAPRIVDCNLEPHQSLYHVAISVFSRKALGDIRFDKELPYTEDAKLLTQVLVKKKKYGIVDGTTYYYRRRKAASSALDTKLFNKKYFTFTLKRAYDFILKLWQDTNGSPSLYVQNLVLNDLQWRLRFEPDSTPTSLSSKEKIDYKNQFYSLIKKIDNEVIISNTMLSDSHKRFLLEKKYGKDVYESKLSFDSGEYSFDNIPLGRIRGRFGIRIEKITPLGGRDYHLEGFLMGSPVSNKDKYYIITNNGESIIEIDPHKTRGGDFLGDRFPGGNYFTVKISLQASDRIRLVAKVGEDGIGIEGDITTGIYSGMGRLNKSYSKNGNQLFRRVHAYHIDVREYTPKSVFIYEIRFMLQILRNLRIGEFTRSLKFVFASAVSLMSIRELVIKLAKPFLIVIRSMFVNVLSVGVRTMFYAGLHKHNKPIWLVSDRGVSGGDNGEALFTYLMETKSASDASIYFAISKKSKDYKRISAIGPVVDIESFKYKVLHLRSNFIISSSADDNVHNPFPRYMWPHLAGLHNHKFVFLQHGVIHSDLSKWLNKFNQNISLFITTSRQERNAILKGDYYYTKDEVVLTGQPRYDLLSNNPKRYLIIAPTWRIGILPEKRGNLGGVRAYSKQFQDSDYFNFYNRLINDHRIVDALKESNMRGRFYIHPAFSRQADDFNVNEMFDIKKMPYNYTKAVNEGSIMVTDYSSVAFDFAYLKKPIVYTQFDQAEFYRNHISSGKSYFSYKNDAFGPIAYDFDDSVKIIVKYIKSQYKMDKIYEERVDSFFEYKDKQNSHRVYQEIISLQGE